MKQRARANRKVRYFDSERTQRIANRVAERARHRRNATLADAPRAERIGWIWRPGVMVYFDTWDIRRLGDLVAFERRRHLLSFIVVHILLEKEIRDALNDAALYLPFHNQGVDDNPGVV